MFSRQCKGLFRSKSSHVLRFVAGLSRYGWHSSRIVWKAASTPRLRSGKRVFDFVGSLALIILGAPLFVLLALLIMIDSAGPVFFRQERVGQNGKHFLMYKFR